MTSRTLDQVLTDVAHKTGETLDDFKARVAQLEQWKLERELGALIGLLHEARCEASRHERSAREWRSVEAGRLEEIGACRQLLGLEDSPIGPRRGDAAPALGTAQIPEDRLDTPRRHEQGE